MLPFVQIFRYIFMFRCIYILFLFLDNILFDCFVSRNFKIFTNVSVISFVTFYRVFFN